MFYKCLYILDSFNIFEKKNEIYFSAAKPAKRKYVRNPNTVPRKRVKSASGMEAGGTAGGSQLSLANKLANMQAMQSAPELSGLLQRNLPSSESHLTSEQSALISELKTALKNRESLQSPVKTSATTTQAASRTIMESLANMMAQKEAAQRAATAASAFHPQLQTLSAESLRHMSPTASPTHRPGLGIPPNLTSLQNALRFSGIRPSVHITSAQSMTSQIHQMLVGQLQSNIPTNLPPSLASFMSATAGASNPSTPQKAPSLTPLMSTPNKVTSPLPSDHEVTKSLLQRPVQLPTSPNQKLIPFSQSTQSWMSQSRQTHTTQVLDVTRGLGAASTIDITPQKSSITESQQVPASSAIKPSASVGSASDSSVLLGGYPHTTVHQNIPKLPLIDAPAEVPKAPPSVSIPKAPLSASIPKAPPSASISKAPTTPSVPKAPPPANIPKAPPSASISASTQSGDVELMEMESSRQQAVQALQKLQYHDFPLTSPSLTSTSVSSTVSRADISSLQQTSALKPGRPPLSATTTLRPAMPLSSATSTSYPSVQKGREGTNYQVTSASGNVTGKTALSSATSPSYQSVTQKSKEGTNYPVASASGNAQTGKTSHSKSVTSKSHEATGKIAPVVPTTTETLGKVSSLLESSPVIERSPTKTTTVSASPPTVLAYHFPAPAEPEAKSKSAPSGVQSDAGISASVSKSSSKTSASTTTSSSSTSTAAAKSTPSTVAATRTRRIKTPRQYDH